MKKTLAIFGTLGILAITIALVLQAGTASANKGGNHGGKHDFSLYDTVDSPPDVSVSCAGKHDFEVYLSLRAFGGDATARVTFLDGDSVDFRVPDNTSFSLAQAAGGTPNFDGNIVVTNPTTTTPGKLVGWMSASAHEGDHVSCTSSK